MHSNNNSEKVTCVECRMSFPKDDLERSCSNCFACTLCEKYICAGCKNEIIIKPVGSKND
jgi:hypothetical protein